MQPLVFSAKLCNSTSVSRYFAISPGVTVSDDFQGLIEYIAHGMITGRTMKTGMECG